MAEDRYVAYVGTYTRGSSVGIHIFDVDAKTWKLTERKVVPINNPSDMLISRDGRYLYAISDFGINAYRILEDGDLEFLNTQWTGGMRGCDLDTDEEGKFLFVAGYHDGRVSVMHLNEDGTVGEIADGIFHQGIGVAITERSSMPHVNCVKMTPDGKGVFAVDGGLDQVKVYDVDTQTGKLTLNDIIRCKLDSSPRTLRLGKNEQFIYLLGEMSNRVCVYRADLENTVSGKAVFESVQKVSTTKVDPHQQAAAASMEFTHDGNHLFVTNAGTNNVTVFAVDTQTGMLTEICSIKCSGDYPKAIAIMPDDEHFLVLSHNTNEMILYKMNYEEGYFLMSAKPIPIEQPNSVVLHRLVPSCS